MRFEQAKKQPSVTNLAVVLVLFIALAFYGFMAVSLGDALWFTTDFTAQPSGITVYCYGDAQPIDQEAAAFEDINALLSQSLSGYKFWGQTSMSDTTYVDYVEGSNSVVIEVSYPESVRVPSLYKFFSAIDTLVIPLEGRHADKSPVFGRNMGNTTAGALFIESNEPLKTYISNNDICPTS